MTALHWACYNGHDRCVAHLLAKGLFVHTNDFARLYIQVLLQCDLYGEQICLFGELV